MGFFDLVHMFAGEILSSISCIAVIQTPSTCDFLRLFHIYVSFDGVLFKKDIRAGGCCGKLQGITSLANSLAVQTAFIYCHVTIIIAIVPNDENAIIMSFKYKQILKKKHHTLDKLVAYLTKFMELYLIIFLGIFLVSYCLFDFLNLLFLEDIADLTMYVIIIEYNLLLLQLLFIVTNIFILNAFGGHDDDKNKISHSWLFFQRLSLLLW